MIINHDTLHILISLTCVILIIFSGMIPWYISEFLDSLVGRLLSIFVILFVTKQFGVFNGILITLALLLLINNSPRLGASSIRGELEEGFSSDLQKRRTQGSRWFVERVLGENPMKIITEKTQTDAVQDLTEKSMNMN